MIQPSDIARHLPFAPTPHQEQLIQALYRFLTMPSDPLSTGRVFVLNGYAGTGKTSVVGALVKALTEIRAQVVLMAPTGRAAKVFGNMAGRRAYTIHRRIYRHDAGGTTGGYPGFTLAENRLTDALFIVDEASMIGEGRPDSAEDLLHDLVEYVYSSPGCRMILLGDTAQLPPVGTDESPAMNSERLRMFGLKVTRATITQTVRQAASSGILYNATLLRRAISAAEESGDPDPRLPELRIGRFRDIRVAEGPDAIDDLADDYGTDTPAETIVITRSNDRALRYNVAIRSMIMDAQEELVRDERLLIVKNNYKWASAAPGLDFLANGDMAVVESIIATEERYGFRFADVRMTLPDRELTFECKILLDTLLSPHPSLDGSDMERLRRACLDDEERYSGMSMTARLRELRHDPYFNALLVKYAYCITCHKAQGGQWKNVYVDAGYIPEDSSRTELLRWLYTAFTRATSRLTLLNPPLPVADQ